MKSARLCATPELMALLCLMGGAMREAAVAHLWVQMLVIGTFNPAFGAVLKTWIWAEERAHAAGDAASWYDPGEDDDEEGDEEDFSDETRVVPMGRHGLALMWRHVTRFGTVMSIALAPVEPDHPASLPIASVAWAGAGDLPGPSQFLFFLLDSRDRRNCALIVPYS